MGHQAICVTKDQEQKQVVDGCSHWIDTSKALINLSNHFHHRIPTLLGHTGIPGRWTPDSGHSF